MSIEIQGKGEQTLLIVSMYIYIYHIQRIMWSSQISQQYISKYIDYKHTYL